MKKIQTDVKQFMLAAEQECPSEPTLSDKKTCELRAKLILEEALEQCRAYGVTVRFLAYKSFFEVTPEVADAIHFEATREPDLVEIADGACDQIYVSVGGAIAMGLDLAPIWELVQNANMAKFGPGSYKREDGKQMKPQGWQSPNASIGNEIERQKYSQSTENAIDQSA